MPTFHITTLETWEHRVRYTVDAPTLPEAYEQIQGQQHAYDRQDVVESGDKVLFMLEATADGEEIRIPPECQEQNSRPDPQCAECQRSFGPHYRGPCEHGVEPAAQAAMEFPCEKCGKVETFGTGSAICEACEKITAGTDARFMVLTLERVTGDGCPEVLIVPEQPHDTDAFDFAKRVLELEMEPSDCAILHGPFSVERDMIELE